MPARFQNRKQQARGQMLIDEERNPDAGLHLSHRLSVRVNQRPLRRSLLSLALELDGGLDIPRSQSGKFSMISLSE